jgi:hypothetical protein
MVPTLVGKQTVANDPCEKQLLLSHKGTKDPPPRADLACFIPEEVVHSEAFSIELYTSTQELCVIYIKAVVPWRQVILSTQLLTSCTYPHKGKRKIRLPTHMLPYGTNRSSRMRATVVFALM